MRKSTLYIHSRLHLKIKPFICPVLNCKKQFTQRSNFTLHYNAVHKNNPEIVHSKPDSEFNMFFDFKIYTIPIYNEFVAHLGLSE